MVAKKNDFDFDFALNSEAFAQFAGQTIELISAYWQSMPELPVKPKLSAGQLAKLFPSQVPREPIAFDQLLDIVQRSIIPGLTHWQHPRFYAYYPAATSIPSVLAELLIAAMGSVGLQWSANPIATELECVVMDWLLDLWSASADSPFRHQSRRGGGLLQNTAGEALVTVAAAARVYHHLRAMGRNLGDSLGADELELLYVQDSSRLVVYCSDQTHFSGPKAMRVAGMRCHRIAARRLANDNLGIDANMVVQQIKKDRSRGLSPALVLLNLGTTNTCGYDDLASFHGFAEAQGVWIHVDAAYAGASLMLPRFADRTQSLLAVAQSFNFNGSKWFLCGFDSAFLFVSDRRFLNLTYTAGGDYLAQQDPSQVYNPEFKDWAIPLGRRFRALRIWMVLSYFGGDGLRAFLQQGLALADELRARIDASQFFIQPVTTDLGLVCLKLADASPSQQQRFLDILQDESGQGETDLLYPSLLEGEPFLRVALGGAQHNHKDLDELWRRLESAAKRTLGR